MDYQKVDVVMMLSGYVLCPIVAYVALQADEIIGAVLALPLRFLNLAVPLEILIRSAIP